MTAFERTLDLSPIADFSLRLDQFAGLWAISEPHALALWRHVQSLDLREHVQRHSLLPQAPLTTENVLVSSGKAIRIISLEGVLTKRGSSLSTAGSTILARQAVRQAAADPAVDGIILRIDSPGGTVAGTYDLAMDVRRAGQSKPVFAFIEDLGASAAYWIASQAERIFANEASALVGSIGTFMGLYDLSEQAKGLGIKPVLIQSGELKGTGFPGTPITDEQRAYLQELVDGAQETFTAAVAQGRGRSIESVSKWATGRVWTAAEALSMGLIDGIQTLDATIAQLESSAAQRGRRRSTNQSERAAMTITPDATPPQQDESPVTVAAIIEECAGFNPQSGEDAMFAVAQLLAGAPLAAVRKSWMKLLAERAEAAREAAEHAARTPKASPGVPPLVAESPARSEDEDSAYERFWSSVAEHVKRGIPRAQAISRTVAEDPERHQRMLAEYNARIRAGRRDG